jgi:hypothetical protein
MRTYLTVPYEQRDAARQLGARWDPGRKLWFVENVENINAFARWMDARLLRPHRPAAGLSLHTAAKVSDREKRKAEADIRRARSSATRHALQQSSYASAKNMAGKR